ncbi:DUF2786 domain-containing protein [Dickeya oryzae]|uniref:DUF2786 domain-containing protein n=1 Tax=Dickeya oryzae TaxID=1240404 RepID=A0AB39IN38_9GAMM|nr:DUF2786 domain-containing protein [Dickeya oryzae]MCA6990839.1 DUF2786 domain-containing protein [Dickeya oryzae]
MANDLSQIRSRIRKLMALGSRNNNANESGRALRLAQKLMQRHGITDDDLSIDAISEREYRQLPSNAHTLPAWLHGLASVVCMATECRCWFDSYTVTGSNGHRRQRRSLHFYGFEQRPEIAVYIFAVLCRQLRHATATHMKSQSRLKLQTRRNRADQFREGYISGVWVVLESFVHPQQHDLLLQRWLNRRCDGEFREATSRQARACRGDRRAKLAGYLAGRNAELNQALNKADSSSSPNGICLPGGPHGE